MKKDINEFLAENTEQLKKSARILTVAETLIAKSGLHPILIFTLLTQHAAMWARAGVLAGQVTQEQVNMFAISATNVANAQIESVHEKRDNKDE